MGEAGIYSACGIRQKYEFLAVLFYPLNLHTPPPL